MMSLHVHSVPFQAAITAHGTLAAERGGSTLSSGPCGPFPAGGAGPGRALTPFFHTGSTRLKCRQVPEMQ